MSFRSRLIAVLCALQCGCLAGEKPASDAPSTPANRLVIEDGQAEVPLLPGNVAPLEVRYLDADGDPLADRVVEFDLSDTRSGASLSPAQVTTDEDGIAIAMLHAGTSNAAFTVRVTAEGANAVSFDITVGDPVQPMARVSFSYVTKRVASSISLTLIPDANCDAGPSMYSSANADSQVFYRIDQIGQDAVFPLDPGVWYAVVASARDDTNGKLASGCADFRAPTTADPDDAIVMVEVPLTDVQLALEDAYAVMLNLDLQQPLAQLALAASSAVSAALAGSGSAGSFYLDAVRAQLASQQAVAFSEARVASGLDQTLTTLLNSSQSGPLRLASELSSLVSALGSSCLVQASYSAEGAGSFRVDGLMALPSPALGAGAKSVNLGAGALSGATALFASYDEAAAKLHIESLSLELGLGSYASALLGGARADASFAARLAAVNGCGSVRTLAATPSWPAEVAPAVAVAACEQAAAGLVERIDTAWMALDAAHRALWLSGSVSVHDRNDDGIVDDLGPSALGGNWGSAASSAPADAVGATLRVPASTALGAL